MVDATGVKITVPAELADTGMQIFAIASSISEELDTLRSQLAPLEAYWQGQSNLSWEQLQAMWNAAATNLMSTAGTLGDISNAVKVNWNNYVDAETTNTSVWQTR
jgi:WXG100 family type VII secretion target